MVNQEAIIIAMAFLLSPLAILAVVLRFQARRIKRAGFGLDDWTILGALMFSLAISVGCLVVVFKGRVGRHAIDTTGRKLLTMDEALVMGKVTYILEWTSAAASGLTKLSVLLLYKRIFLAQGSTSHPVFGYALWTMLIVCMIWTMLFFFLDLLGCMPISRNWVIPHSVQGCLHLRPLWNTQVISDIITDAMILSLPWIPLRKLQLPFKTKFKIACIFLLGAFTVAAGIARAYEFHVVLKYHGSDSSYVFAPADYWTNIQACVGVISACLPCLAPMVVAANTSYEKLRFLLKRTVRSSSFNSGLSCDEGKPHDNESLGHADGRFSVAGTSIEQKQIIRTDTWSLETNSRAGSDNLVSSTVSMHPQL